MTPDQTLFARIDRGILVGDTVRQKDQTKLMIVQEISAGEIICGWHEYDHPSLTMAKFLPDELILVRYGKS